MMLIELLTKVFSDPLPETNPDGIFIFSQTIDNQNSVLNVAKNSIKNGVTDKVMFIDTPPLSGYPGFANWSRELKKRHIDMGKIEGVKSVNNEMLHTLIEAQSLINHLRGKKYTSILISATPFHQLRAFMTVVTVALTDLPDLRIYNLPGQALSWQDLVVHSQGSLRKTRSELIHKELGRIKKYQQKGDLTLTENILKYLDQRG